MNCHVEVRLYNAGVQNFLEVCMEEDTHFFLCLIQDTLEKPPKCGNMDKSEKFRGLGIMQAGQ